MARLTRSKWWSHSLPETESLAAWTLFSRRPENVANWKQRFSLSHRYGFCHVYFIRILFLEQNPNQNLIDFWDSENKYQYTFEHKYHYTSNPFPERPPGVGRSIPSFQRWFFFIFDWIWDSLMEKEIEISKQHQNTHCWEWLCGPPSNQYHPHTISGHFNNKFQTQSIIYWPIFSSWDEKWRF